MFQIGGLYNRKTDIHDKYGGQQQSGIVTPRLSKNIFLFTGETGERHGYRDAWNEEGLFLYTGQGQVGDMEFVRGNRAVRDHSKSGKDLFLFKAVENLTDYCFMGKFRCVGWNECRGPDRRGKERRIIIFKLQQIEEPERVKSV